MEGRFIVEKLGHINCCVYFRYYEGEVPTLVVADPELVKQITIKDFQKFHCRKVSAFSTCFYIAYTVDMSQG